MSDSEFKDKFIAFVDVLGFKSMIEAAEDGTGRPLSEIRDILAELGRQKDKEFFRTYGPDICPQSAYVRKDLDFQITQVSDCAIASSEVSPAGVVNLVSHWWSAAVKLLTKGVMVRGYITRGPIYHEGIEFYGTGYHNAYERESKVSAFKREADEKGTPFIEVDPTVRDYVHDETDECVREMFSRHVKTDGELIALFPFQHLSHSFGGFGASPFDPGKENKSNDNMRERLVSLKERVLQYVDHGNDRAMRKALHYIAALDHQLALCDRIDAHIDRLSQPFPGRRL